MIGTTSVAALYVARIILGVANGLFITTAQMYIVEVLPPNLRGVGLGMYAMIIVIGTTMSAVMTQLYQDIHFEVMPPNPCCCPHGGPYCHIFSIIPHVRITAVADKTRSRWRCSQSAHPSPRRNVHGHRDRRGISCHAGSSRSRARCREGQPHVHGSVERRGSKKNCVITLCCFDSRWLWIAVSHKFWDESP
jgi:Sugar (and other) transporter